MARSETEGGSNWVSAGVGKGEIKARSSDTDKGTDILTIKPCTRFEKVAAGEESNPFDVTDGLCKYSEKSQLRYIYVY